MHGALGIEMHTHFLIIPAAMWVALLVDRLLGEPPTWAHPVVAIGRYLGAFKSWLPGLPPTPAFLAGALLWCLGAGLTATLAWAVEAWLWQQFSPWQGWGHVLLMALVLGLMLKPLLAWRMLREEVLAVEAALAGSLAAGRERLSWLVSRDTRQLSETEVREAALETLAENLSDSVVAPLLWFAIAGLPGAALYRFANTADAMWGYRGAWEWAGKFAARADDLLNWLPARLTGVLMRGSFPWRQLRQEARHTPSPNGGWPMAALALRLGLRLAKPGVYVLHATGRAPVTNDLQLAVRLCGSIVLRASLLLAVLAWLIRATHPGGL